MSQCGQAGLEGGHLKELGYFHMKQARDPARWTPPEN